MKKVVIVGAGHNGLAAAVLLAQGGVSVRVVEARKTIGGAVRTERPFAKAPNLGASTGAYLLGLMPPELKQKLELDVRTIRRDPHYFLPTTDGRYLLFGSERSATRDQMVRFFSQQDYDADCALQDEIGKSATTSRRPGSRSRSRSRRPPKNTCARPSGRRSSICAASPSRITSRGSASRASS